MRGEYIPRASERPERGELPPRARRIPAIALGDLVACGTTSACAENTPATGGSCTQNWNYLRVRGEYIAPWRHRAMAVELPPRARRIRDRTVLVDVAHGTTSACAENTDFLDSAGDVGGNYLRVRGEYTMYFCAVNATQELPPRARRIRVIIQLDHGLSGTTSACAENTRQGHELAG